MPAKDPRLYLMHIRECCERILDYTRSIESSWPSVPVVHRCGLPQPGDHRRGSAPIR
jgi:hypothetical protein